jgi:aminoglycoside 2''-phosphotransferase
MPEDSDTRLIASGFSSFVYETREGCILRVARTAEAAKAYEREFRFLPFLAAHLPVSVPVPISCTGGRMLYPKLRGEPLTVATANGPGRDEIARQIASILQAFARIPIEAAVNGGIPRMDRTAGLLQAAGNVAAALPPELGDDIQRWRGTFERNLSLTTPRTCVIHGDLWHENVLIDNSDHQVSGLIDFEQTSIGDPAWDVAAQRHAGEDFARMVWGESYAGDMELWARADLLFQLRPFEGLRWAIEQNDRAELADGLVKLQAVGVLPVTGSTRITTAAWLGTLAE